MKKKLFISYSDNDRDVALNLRQALIESGYDVWIAREDMTGSVLWTQTVLDAIDNAEGVVLLWSQRASTSKHVSEEVRIARVFLKPIFPVATEPVEKIPSLPDEINSFHVINLKSRDLNIAELKRRLSDSKRNYLKFPQLDTKLYIPKHRNPYFVGRKRELKELFVDVLGFHRQDRVGLPIAISGLAGIGKTHLALTFGYRFDFFFPDGVYWIDTPNGIIQEFEKIGNHLNLKRHREERPLDHATRVKDKLGQLNKGLVIFDNVTDIAEFRKWCPEGSRSCSVILTTRKSPHGFPVRVMNLTELDAEAAYELIISRRQDRAEIEADEKQQQALKKICEIMGNHPLALEQCASFLQSSLDLPTDFLKELGEKENALSHFANKQYFQIFLGEGEVNLLDVLTRNYNSLDRKRNDRYFLLMCWFAPHGINNDLIINAYGKANEGKEALQELAENSLIYRETPRTVSLHPLVARFGRSLSKTLNADYHKKFVEVTFEFLKKNRDSLSSEEVRAELPHVFEAIEVSREHGFWDLSAQLHLYCAKIVAGMDKRIELLNAAHRLIEEHLPNEKRKLLDIFVQLGKTYRTKEQFKDALAAFDDARTLYNELPEVDPGENASLQFELGDAYLAMGQYDEARRRLNRAQDIALNVASYDATTPEVTRIKQALAKIDLSLGNLGAAEKAFREVLEHREQFHAKHPDPDTSLGIGSSYADLSQLALQHGNYEVAVSFAEKALAIIKEYHRENEASYGNLLLLLGNIHYQAGNYPQAEEQIEKARQSYLSIFGDRHPNYAKTLVALSELDRRLGKFGPAREKSQQAVKIMEDRYGENHPSVAEALEVQGKIYDHLCQFDEEEQVWNRILNIQTKVYDENHPAIAATHYDYGNLFLRKGDYDEALKHLEKSLSITEKSLGKNHSHYFGRLIRLATCYYERQNYSLAGEKLKEAQTLQKAIFGKSLHPYVARMHQLQSEVNRRLGKFDAALASIDQAIKMKEELYGKEHPSVAEAVEIKVKVFHHQGETTEAKLLIERALKIRKDHYGEKHPEVGRSEHDLGSYYLRQGQYDDAISHFEKALEISNATYGKYHLEYIERALHLANALYEKGEYPASLKLVKDLESVIAKTIASKNHYLKARWLFGMAELYRRQGQFTEALDYIGKAVDMRVAIYGEVHPSVAEVLECRGKIYDHLCEFDQEEQVWQKIIESKVYPENHPASATTHYHYGNLCLRRGEFDAAQKHIEKSLSITENSLGKKHSHYFGRLVLLAACYYEQQKYSQAEDQLKEAQTLQQDIFGESPHPYIARMHQLQSEVNRRLGKFDAALKSIDQTIKLKEEIYGKDHPSVAEALEVKVKIFHHQGETEQAKQLIDRALKIRIDHYGERHHEVGRSEHDLGSYYLRLGQYDDAITHFKKALEITEATFGKFHPEYIERSLHLADALNEKGEYHSALKIVEELDGIIKQTIVRKNHYLKARWLQDMAELQRRLSHFEKARDYISQALEMKESIYGKVHPSVAEALEIQGKIFDHLGEFDKEEQVWNRILDIQAKVYSENHPAAATTHYHYGNLCLKKGEFDEALKHLVKSLTITEASLGKNNSHYFGRLILLAACYYEQQKYSQAKEKLKEAQRSRKLIFGKSSHPFIARMYQLLSEVDRRLGKFRAALKRIDQAIKMKDGIYGKEHPSVAEALEVKADIYLAQFRANESKELLDWIERIRKDAYGEKHPGYANYQLRLAEYYSLTGRYQDAQDILEKSMQTCSEKFASGHAEIINRLVMSARLARISSDIGTAEKRINQAREALGTRLQTEKSLIVASVLKESAIVKRKQGDFNTSLAELEKGIEIEAAILGANSAAVIESLVNKVKLLIVFNRLKEAELTIQTTTEKAEAEEPIYKRLRADLLDQRGILETTRGEFDQAVKSFDEALELKRQVLDKANAELAKLLVDEAVALRATGKHKEALDNLEEAQNIINPLFNENHLFFARIFLEIGRTHYEKKSYVAAKEQLEDALKIYLAQPNQDLREHASVSETLGLVHLETGLASKASQLFGDALEIKKSIYDSQHPEIAKTLHNEARALLKMEGTGESRGKHRAAARQKLEDALQILRSNGQNGIEQVQEIESTLSTL